MSLELNISTAVKIKPCSRYIRANLLPISAYSKVIVVTISARGPRGANSLATLAIALTGWRQGRGPGGRGYNHRYYLRYKQESMAVLAQFSL